MKAPEPTLREPTSLDGIRAVLRSCVRNAPGYLALALVLTTVAGLTGPATAWALQRIVDTIDAESQGMEGSLAHAVALLILATLAVTTVPVVARFVVAQLGRAVGMAANVELYGAVNGIDRLDEFEHPDFQDRLHLAQEASHAASIQMISALTNTVRSGTAGISYAILVVHTEPSLLLALALGSVPVVWSVVREGRRELAVISHSAPLSRKMGFFSSLMSEPQAVKELRVFSLGDYFLTRMTRELDRLQGLRRGAELRALLEELLAAVLSGACAAGAIWYVANEAVQGRLSAGAVVAVAAAVGGTTAALSGVASGVVGTWTAGATYRHLLVLGQRVGADGVSDERSVRPADPDLSGGLSVRHVSFEYPGTGVALRDVSFEVAPGRSLAIVGANGAGKSTLLKVLARIYRPTAGELWWNGRAVWDQLPEWYLDDVSAVFQDFMTYDLTVGENIGIGDVHTPADRAKVVLAARSAGAEGFIGNLPHGYDTLLSRTFASDEKNDAAFLSGGQWQRLAVARALVSDPSILILDEPTSGGDVSVERRFRDLMRAREGVGITICVSHRLSLVRDCSEILVLNEGRVVERGTHAELMGLEGRYAEMFVEQASAYTLTSDVAR